MDCVFLYLVSFIKLGCRLWGHTELDTTEATQQQQQQQQHSENEDHGIGSHHFMGNRWGNSGNSVGLYFFGAPKSLQTVIVVMKLKDAYSLEGKL